MFSKITRWTKHGWLYLKVAIHIFLFITVAGCSFIDRERNFIADTSEKSWSKVKYTNSNMKEQIQFKSNKVTLTTNSTFHVNSCPISIGPPLVPVIPVFFLCFNNDYDFGLSLDVKTNQNENRINMQGLKIITPEGKTIPIYRGSYCAVDEEPSQPTFLPSCREMKTIPSTPFVIGKGRFRFLLTYKGIGDPEKITLEFTEVYFGVDVPPISLRGDNSYIFCPFAFSGHERCFNF